jgi:hypothetical protein
MILVHEHMPREAEDTAIVLKEVYGIESVLIEDSLDKVFVPIPEFQGFVQSYYELIDHFKIAASKKLMVLTPKDIYISNQNKDDEWIFGYQVANLAVISTARMKRSDSQPSSILEVPYELYKKRLQYLAIHELGHDIIQAQHFRPASWVNAKTGNVVALGDHCTDNGCVMYEINDIQSPAPETGYLLLGDEQRFDSGLDPTIARLGPDWFCRRCSDAKIIGSGY